MNSKILDNVILVFQIILIVLGPYACIRLVKYFAIEDWLSPVVLSYLLGIILANIGDIGLSPEISKHFSEIPILLAIPMLLYSTNILAWFKYAKSTIISFLLCILSGVIASFIMAYFFSARIENTWMLSGMMVGIYTGGIPNMQAIGMALGAEEEIYILVNAADIFCGGIYLIFLTSIAHRFLGSFLPDFIKTKKDTVIFEYTQNKISLKNIIVVFALTIGIVGLSIGLVYLITGALKSVALIILFLTSFSVLASLSERIRSLHGTYEIGEYLLLMFCVAIGMMANFENIMSKGLEITMFIGAILSTTVVLHWLFSFLFKIDRDTTLIMSTAALYGPAFVGQVANAIKNRELIFSGMATGLVGYAVGNYLGITVGYLLKYLLG